VDDWLTIPRKLNYFAWAVLALVVFWLILRSWRR
jgi:hypothetical protein